MFLTEENVKNGPDKYDKCMSGTFGCKNFTRVGTMCFKSVFTALGPLFAAEDCPAV